MLENNQREPRIAYFSMEIAIKNSIKSFSGGLGVLAGDTLKSAADLEIPVVAVTLLNKDGYFKQKISEKGHQVELQDQYDTSELELAGTSTVKIGADKVRIKIWRYSLVGRTGYTVPVYFLDSDCGENKDKYKNLTGKLYGGDNRYRLMQEIILGRGGVRALRALGMDKIKKYHLNEGHAALATLELFSDLKPKPFSSSPADIHKRSKEIRESIVFTTHTPVAAGHDVFSLDLVRELQPDFPYNIPELITDRKLNMSRLAAYFSSYINGVSKKHGEVSREIFPGYEIDFITNGVHSETWTGPDFKNLFDKHIPSWRSNNLSLRNALKIPNREIWNAHQSAKERLVRYIEEKTEKILSKEVFTIGFARRFATYKRPDLIFEDIERLLEINDKVGKIQIIYAGKAHPHDGMGKEKIRKVNEVIKKNEDKIGLVFLENYDMEIAKLLVAGVDLWLNNPIPPKEGSGTSGMKAAHNGVPQLSTKDGWWLEGFIPQKTGWSIGIEDKNQNPQERWRRDAEDIYKKLASEIIPTYYKRRGKWIEIMKNCISTNGSYFNSERMLFEYIRKAYL